MNKVDIVDIYLKGREEGYFNVKLGYEISYTDDPETKAFFAKGRIDGEKIRKEEKRNESEAGYEIYKKNRKAYITIIGYRSVVENYIADSSQLKDEEDIKAFEDGCRIARDYIKNDFNVDNSNLYALITGYNNAIKNNLNCFFVMDDENKSASQRGYTVAKICKDLRKQFVNETFNDLKESKNISRKK